MPALQHRVPVGLLLLLLLLRLWVRLLVVALQLCLLQGQEWVLQQTDVVVSWQL